MKHQLIHKTFEDRFIDLVGIEHARDKIGIQRKIATKVLHPIDWQFIPTMYGVGAYVRADELLLACVCLDDEEVCARPGDVTIEQLYLAWKACGWYTWVHMHRVFPAKLDEAMAVGISVMRAADKLDEA